MCDAEAAHGGVELLRRATVPVHGVLELVRVEVQGAGEVILLVLLGDAEVDVEEQEASGRRSLRAVAVEHLAEPSGVDEPVVVREMLHGQALVRRPRVPVVGANSRVAERGEPAPHGRHVVGRAVEDDLLAGDDLLRVQQADDLGVVDARQPGARERDRSGDVTPPGLAVQAPAVVRVERPHVDDRQVGVEKSPAQLFRRNLLCHRARLLLARDNDLFET